MRTFSLNRNVTPEECPWLPREMLYGETVYEFRGATYGYIGSGIAVTFEADKGPFFELPRDALTG